MGANAPEVVNATQSREALRQLIAQWNANRLDLFEISEPNEDGEFQGVMRFYFQEAGAKVATKCIRIASSATTKAVIDTLIEKFRPDMRMLSVPQYALYEIHESGEERKLDDHERPLLVQLNWHSDDREGRFLLKRIDEQVRYDFSSFRDNTGPSKVVPEVTISESFKRKLSKREKKQLKKLQEKTKAAEAAKSAAEKLYNELPETSFTRSISNPEAVMRRRRQQKLEKKLAQFRSRDGGPDTGGTLKIYGQSLCEDVPYKTLLLSVNDNAAYVVKEMLAKYGLTNQDPQNYCLVQVTEGESGEYILDEDESPLAILMSQPNDRGSIMFHVRRRPPDCHPRKRKKKPTRRADDEIGSGYRGSYDGQHEPMLVELLPDGSETGRRIALETDVTEVGSEWGGLQLAGLRPRHCVIASTDGIVTLTPSSRDADIYVNGQRIYETTILQHGAIIRFGRTHYFRFSHRAGQPFSEREIIESPTAANNSSNNNNIPGGGVDGRTTLSPPLSPTQDEAPRMIRPDSILPATLELPEAAEEAYLSVVILNVIPANLQFKLAPTYAIYLAARYRATTHFRPDVTPHERAHLLSAFLLRVSHILMQVVQERNSDANSLAFWMANSSELLHFLKSDRQIGAFSLDAQDVLAEVVQLAFRHLVTCIQGELSTLVGHFFLERDEEDDNATTPMLGVLGSGMTLLRRSRVNAALTIQLFSQLFHFINMAVFNKLIVMDGRNYCSRLWGNRLRRRLSRIETWAEKQGLELAADCHLVRVIQACHLLQAPKSTPDEVAAAASSCFKLNSLQLQCLLMKYQYEPDEIPIPPEVLDNVVRVAESTVDEQIRADGRHIRVEEEPLIGLAFILPEDGYSCDIVRGIPTGLVDFLTPLSPLCRLSPNPSAAGYWTIYFQDPMRSPSAMSGRSFAAAFNNLTIGSGGGQPPLTPGSVISDSRHSMMNNNMTNLNMSMSNMSMNSVMGQQQNHVGSAASGSVLSPNGSVGGGSGVIGMANGHIGGGGGGGHHQLMNGNAGNGGMLPQKPEVHSIKLQKISNGLGLSIVAAKPAGQDVLGIYIKSVVKHGSADVDGRLAAGDQLLSVDGQSLIGISQEEAAKYLVRTGPVVTLEVAKQAALYHGLATMLNQPSPELSRGKGDGQDLSFEEDDEFSGDDVELYEAAASSGYHYYHQHHQHQRPHHLYPHPYAPTRYVSYSANTSPYNYNNSHYDMYRSCSSQTLVASESMHLLSPPRPSDDFLRRPAAFPHQLQIHVEDYSDKFLPNNGNTTCHLGQTYTNAKGSNAKLVRQLSFPEEEDEEEEASERTKNNEDETGGGGVVTQMSIESNNEAEGSCTMSGAETFSERKSGDDDEEENITVVDAGNEVMEGEEVEEKSNENDLSTSSTSTTSSSEMTLNDRTPSSSSNSYSIPINKADRIREENGDKGIIDKGQTRDTANNKKDGSSAEKGENGNDKEDNENKSEEEAAAAAGEEGKKGNNNEEKEEEDENEIVDVDTKRERNEVEKSCGVVDRRSLASRHRNYPMLTKKAVSMPQCCTFLEGIALSPTTIQSYTDLIALGKAAKHYSIDNFDESEDTNTAQEIGYHNLSSSSVIDNDNVNVEEDEMSSSQTEKAVSTSLLLTSFSLNDISLTSSKNSRSRTSSNLRDSNYWSSNCSTRDDNSTLCSPESVSSATAAMMRNSHSDSSLARWNDSFDALSRRGLSESALGVPRVVGSSRLLKFLINTYNNESVNNNDNDNDNGNYGERVERGRKRQGNVHYLPTRSRSSDAVLDDQDEHDNSGFNAPRRMSERDLPSKVLREQNHDLSSDHPQFGHGGGGPNHPLMMQGRIHSSKSVPSLNDVGPNNVPGPNGLQQGGGMNHSGNPQMIRSPGHHPNNMNNSQGHQMMQSHGQLPNHMNEPQNGMRYPQGYPNMSMTMQHGSKSSMMSGHMNSVDAQTAAMRSRSIQSLADPPHRPDIGNKQPSTPALHMQQPEDTERFYQNVGFYPPPPPPPTNPANMPVRTYIPYSNSTGNISSSAAFRSPGGGGNHISPHYPGYPGVRAPPPNLNASVPSNLNWQQQQQRINHTGHVQQLPPQQQQQQTQPQQFQQNHGVSRDLLRQEAKMLEMQDELRRREERAALMVSKQQQHQQQQQQQQRYTQYPNQQQRPLSGAGPPAPAPKPYRAGDNPEMAPGRPPLPDEFKHPNQFSASMTEIPKGAFSYNNGVITKPSQLVQRDPWDREAKEAEAKRRKEAAKYWRDQQIMELEQFPNKTPTQEEQLRALKLEREFQRRAEEMQRHNDDGAEDDEEEEEDDRKAMVRRLQEDLERTRISGTNGNSKLDPMEEERARKIEEMRKKKLELEAAQAAEERLVREAAKRREEELRRQHHLMQQQNQSLKLQQQQSQMHLQQQLQQQQHQQQQHPNHPHHQPPQPPQTLSYQSPYRSSYTSKLGSPGSINSQTILTSENHLSPSSSAAPPLPKSPPPVVTSYKSAMQQSASASSSSPQKSPVTPPQSSPKPKSDKKTVSFNETVATNEPPASPQEEEDQVEQGEKVREDPNKFLSEATALLASPRSPDVTIGSGSTPGVIGAQEVYRDPRMRRLAEKQQQQQAANTPKPEKLTFKEKMRMFAMESGDVESPKDKVKK